MKKLIPLILVVLFLTDCEKERISEDSDNLIFDVSVPLAINECLYNHENQIYICLDSVLNDSRCPTGVYCIWEGNAEVRFRFETTNENPVLFNLNTHKGFKTYTIVSGYKITLLNLDPYPVEDHRINQNDYKAEILIEKE